MSYEGTTTSISPEAVELFNTAINYGEYYEKRRAANDAEVARLAVYMLHDVISKVAQDMRRQFGTVFTARQRIEAMLLLYDYDEKHFGEG